MDCCPIASYTKHRGGPMKLAFALSGGGARGAYSAGVQRYLFTELPKKLGYIPFPQLVSGASVGSMNGYFAACHSMLEVVRMTELWTHLNINQMYNIPLSSLSLLKQVVKNSQMASLLDATPFYKLIHQEAARRTLRSAIHPQKCEAFLVSSTHMYSGQGVFFADVWSPKLKVKPPPCGRVHYTRIYPKHILASAAIPLLFPPVEIEGQYYLDGSLKQYVPLQPLLDLNATRILILGTRAREEDQLTQPPDLQLSLSMVGGSSLGAMISDYVERDMVAAEQVNTLIDWGKRNYGDDFEQKLKADLSIQRSKIKTICPSFSLSRLAREIFDVNKINADANTKWLMSWLNDNSSEQEGSVALSSIFFDPLYTRAAEDLGFQDAQKLEDSLLEWLQKDE